MSPGCPRTLDGGSGGPVGVALTELDGGPVPSLLVAVTLMLYVVPLVSSVMVQVSEPVVVQYAPPGEAMAV